MKAMVDTRHAVLYGLDAFPPAVFLWTMKGQDEPLLQYDMLSEPCLSVLDVVGIAYRLNLTHVWVMPDYELFHDEVSSRDFSIKYQMRYGKAASASVWQRGKKHGIQIIFMQHTSWGWMKEAEPAEIVLTIHYLEEALGVPVGSSPGRVGWAYLKKLYPDWTEAIEADWKGMRFTASAATDIIWHRPMIDSFISFPAPGGRYLHKFDKAAAYPYAASQTDIGVGTPVHFEFNDAQWASQHVNHHPQEVGVWRCYVKYDESKISRAMPPVWKEDREFREIGDEWLAGPVIRLLRSMGHTVDAVEGWVFPERHDVLKKWAEDLWEVREDFDKHPLNWKNHRCAKLAAKAVKTIMNTTIGMTAFKRFEEDDEMRRPDIRLQVIARHRELMRQNIEKFWVLYGASPLIVYMDALYYLSDNPNGREAFPAIVKREGLFGGYRYEGRIDVTPEVVDLLHGKNEASILEALNAIGWKKGDA